MAKYDRLARVMIELRTARLTGSSFALPLLLCETAAFTERTLLIDDPDQLLKKGVKSGDEAYKIASIALAQKAYGGIGSVIVGRKAKEESYTDAVSACRAETSTFRALAATTRDPKAVVELASWADAHGVLFVTASPDTQVADPKSSTDVLSLCKPFTRAVVIYDPASSGYYPEAALLGRCLGKQQGQTWENQRIAGCKPLADETASVSARAKGALTIESFSNGPGSTSVTITQGAQVASGEWIDIIRGRDWLQEQMSLNVAQVFIDADIKYNDAGIAIVEGRMRQTLSYAQRIGFIDDDVVLPDGTISPGFSIRVPRRADIAANTVASRKLIDMHFDARVSGGIHLSEIDGTLSYSTDIR